MNQNFLLFAGKLGLTDFIQIFLVTPIQGTVIFGGDKAYFAIFENWIESWLF